MSDKFYTVTNLEHKLIFIPSTDTVRRAPPWLWRHTARVLRRFIRGWRCDPADCGPPGFSVLGILRQEYWEGCHALLQRVFPTQGWNPHLFHPLHQLGSIPLAPPGKLMTSHDPKGNKNSFWFWIVLSHAFISPYLFTCHSLMNSYSNFKTQFKHCFLKEAFL